METTNSDSSGRKQRYSPPAEEVTVKPSSRPISSSCSMWPRLEKKRLPATSSKLWRRPFWSTRRIHSPTRSGPRWTPDQASAGTSGATSGLSDTPGTLVGRLPERSIDVCGRQDAQDRPVGLDEEVLAGRRPAEGHHQVVALQVRR